MSPDDPDYPVTAPGWAAIDRVCLAMHRGQVPHQFTSSRAYDLEGTSPLPAISVWEAHTTLPPNAAPELAREHWHYVGYGLSELFEKSSPVASISGLGYELCVRIPRAPDETTPPAWPLRLIQGVAHYAMSGHREIETGDVLDLGGPITGARGEPTSGPPTVLEGVVCIPDALGKIPTPHGSLLFLLLVGLAREELELVQLWDPQRRVGLVHEAAPGGVTDPSRMPWSSDPRTKAAFRRYQMGVLI
jgi:hypothetical protein